ncbi:MAG: hypothetical protein KY469_20505 [Actinobacteria bacterium]|nr:hypothetical protein [Actinomycetota bacterium]
MPDEEASTEVVTIDRRFRGPLRSGNGGVSAGLAARFIEGPATVRLRRPPPLDRPLGVRRVDGAVHVFDGQELVMEASPAATPVEPPLQGAVLERTLERGTTPPPERHRAPECFVCGPRDDGLRICPRHLPGTQVWSTVWTPDDSVSSIGAVVDAHIVWGALDCPAGIAVVRGGLAELTFFPALTSLAATIEHPVPVGRPVAVLGWLISEDERRINGGTAVVGSDGTVLASAYAQHARLPLDFGSR